MMSEIFNPFSEAARPQKSLQATLIAPMSGAVAVLVAGVLAGVTGLVSFDVCIEWVQRRNMHLAELSGIPLSLKIITFRLNSWFVCAMCYVGVPCPYDEKSNPCPPKSGFEPCFMWITVS